MPDNKGLVLEIVSRDNGLSMSLFEQEAVSSTLRHYSLRPVSFTEINELCEEISSVLNCARKPQESQADPVKALMKAGQLLWGQLLTRQVSLKLKSSQLTGLILSLDEELTHIPWELLCDGTNFLCLNFNLGRTVRTKKEAPAMDFRSPAPALKMLILANPTDDLKSAYLEGVNIKNQFDRRCPNVRIEFKSTSIDRLYVLKNIRDYDIVHFAGHCEYAPEDTQAGGWVLSDGRLSTGDIMVMGASFSFPSLVFSNACHSAASPVNQDYQAINSSLSCAFLFSGVRHYIGTTRRIEDPVSHVFAREFYSQLITGKSTGECLRQGRLKLIKEYGIQNIAWAGYLLYGDPNFALFRSAISPRTKIKKHRVFYKKSLVGLSVAMAATAVFLFLYLWLPSVNPSVYYLYGKAHSMFLTGKNEQVILLANRVIEMDPLYLAVYPLLADTYRRLGDKEKALKYYFDYARYSEKKSDKSNLFAAYIGLGWCYHLQGDFPKAFDFYNKALVLCRENSDKLNEADVLGKLAVWHMDKKDYDVALELLTKSAEIDRWRPKSYKQKYNLACDYFNLGLLFANKRDFTMAKEFYDKSLVLFTELKLIHELSDYYFNVGEIYSFEKEYHKAMDFYLKGLDIDRMKGNIWSLASDYDMLGELAMEMDDLKKAEEYFQLAIATSQKINALPELASASRNLARLYKKARKKNKAREYFRQAQEIYSSIDTSDYNEIKKELYEL
ncbi:MAG: tetratricopeptide repeat protein [Candidatus Omnitrophota bacterium]|nr:tetratricopeptide repeat protein [Candidatus Omnitrophota bacterium]